MWKREWVRILTLALLITGFGMLEKAAFAGGLVLSPNETALVNQPLTNSIEGWVSMGEGGSVDLEQDVVNPMGAKGALAFHYPIDGSSISAATLPTPDGLAGMKSLHFWIKCDHTAAVIVSLSEKDGGRYNATFTAPKDQWQEVALAPSDFGLGTEATDPPDPDGKLDLDQVQAITIFDLYQLLSKVKNSNLAAVINAPMGQHTFYLSHLTISQAALPTKLVSGTNVVISDYSRPQVNWIGIGGVTLKQESADSPLKQPSLLAEYEQGPNRIVALIHDMHPYHLTLTSRLQFDMASSQAATLVVQLEETDGGKYNSTINMPGGDQVQHLQLKYSDFTPAQDSQDTNDRLDMDKIKTLTIIDFSGATISTEQINRLWLGKVVAVGKS